MNVTELLEDAFATNDTINGSNIIASNELIKSDNQTILDSNISSILNQL